MEPVLRVATFNIRFDRFGSKPLSSSGSDATNVPVPEKQPSVEHEQPWSSRRRKLADGILFHRVDLVGLQEALRNQILDLQVLLGDDWGWIGVGREDGKESGEHTPIFYNKRRLELLDSTNFWLSPTPETPGSVGWDAALPRVATQAKFTDKVTGHVFYHICTHFDHRGENARIASADLILSRAREVTEADPVTDIVLVTLDMNAYESSVCYKEMTGRQHADDAPEKLSGARSFAFSDTRYEIARPDAQSFGHSMTFTGFSTKDQAERIDYVMLNSKVLGKGDVGKSDDGSVKVRVLNHGVVENRFDDNLYISDHRIVLADLLFVA